MAIYEPKEINRPTSLINGLHEVQSAIKRRDAARLFELAEMCSHTKVRDLICYVAGIVDNANTSDPVVFGCFARKLAYSYWEKVNEVCCGPKVLAELKKISPMLWTVIDETYERNANTLEGIAI